MSDAAEARWVAYDDIAGYGMWPETHRIIDLAWKKLQVEEG